MVEFQISNKTKKNRDLDESGFIRSQLGDESRSAWRRYARLTIGKESIAALLLYELKLLFFNSFPGVIGLVLRKMFYPRMFRACGKRVTFGRNLILRNTRNITIGDNVMIDDNVVLDGRGAVEKGVSIGNDVIIGRNVILQSKVGDIAVGDSCNIGAYTIIVSQGGTRIGEWTQIAGGCKISGGRFQLEPDMRDGRPYSRYTMGPIEIGKTCFLGGSATVTDGCKIGDCSVIGAGAVVMSDIPEYSVYMPRPGMVIGKTSSTDN